MFFFRQVMSHCNVYGCMASVKGPWCTRSRADEKHAGASSKPAPMGSGPLPHTQTHTVKTLRLKDSQRLTHLSISVQISPSLFFFSTCSHWSRQRFSPGFFPPFFCSACFFFFFLVLLKGNQDVVGPECKHGNLRSDKEQR